jgi:hypothetical protein
LKVPWQRAGRQPCQATLAPEATLTQIISELRSAFDWLNARGAEHGIAGPTMVTVVGRHESFSGQAPSLALGIKMNVDSRQRQTARCTPLTKRIPSAGRVSVV